MSFIVTLLQASEQDESLCQAALRGDVQLVKQLLLQGANADALDEEASTFLCATIKPIKVLDATSQSAENQDFCECSSVWWCGS